MVDPFEVAKARPLTDHIKDWLESLARKGRSEKYISNAELRSSKLVKKCEWIKLTDVNVESFQRWLDDQGTLSNKTRNHYIGTLNAFCNWAVSQKRMPENPLKFISRYPVDGFEKRPRWFFSEDELSRFLAAIPEEYKLVYLMAVFTGLRRGELMALEWGDFSLNSPKPFIHLRAETTKSKRADTIPLRIDLAQWLRDARGDALNGEKVFAHIPSMLRHKTWLKQAGIDWKDDKGRQADFHALRTTLCTMLNKQGVSLQTAMAIMRHTDIRLTTKTYNDIRLYDISGAVEKLPGITLTKNSDQEKAHLTGTDDQRETVESGGKKKG